MHDVYKCDCAALQKGPEHFGGDPFMKSSNCIERQEYAIEAGEANG
jgi:hypothetical protein